MPVGLHLENVSVPPLFVATRGARFDRECWQDYMDAWGSTPRRETRRHVLLTLSRLFFDALLRMQVELHLISVPQVRVLPGSSFETAP